MTVLTIPESSKNEVSGKETYNQQYCKKHNQKYGSHLHRCPICVGEELDGTMIKIVDLTGTLTEEDVIKLMNPSGKLKEINIVREDKGV